MAWERAPGIAGKGLLIAGGVVAVVAIAAVLRDESVLMSLGELATTLSHRRNDDDDGEREDRHPADDP